MNEILDELWKVKDLVSKQYDNDVELLVKELKNKEKMEKRRIVDLSAESKKTV